MTDIKHFAQVPELTTSQVDYFLLDASSSMMDQWIDIQAAVDGYIDSFRTSNVDTTILLASFSTTDIHYLHRECNIKDWTPLARDPIGIFGGMTPLYDGIAEMARKLRDMNPPRASCVIGTDGDENGSQYTDLTQARALVKWMLAKGWQVTFIGCDWDNTELANKLGVHPSAAIGVSKAKLVDATKALAEKRAKYARSGEQMHWSDDERSRFGGYLSGY